MMHCMGWRRVVWLLPLFLTPPLFSANDPPPSPDEQTLRAAGFATNAPALLDYFHKRTLSEVNRGEIATLIQQLGDKSFAVRERASAQLLRYGPGAVELLSAALKDRDLEVVARAERCLQRI